MGGLVAFSSLLSFGCALLMRLIVQLLPVSDRVGALEFSNLVLTHCPGLFAEGLVIAILLRVRWANTALIRNLARASIVSLGISVLAFCMHGSYSLSSAGQVNFVGSRAAVVFAESVPYAVAFITVPMLLWAFYAVSGPQI